ncbi:MAG: hypothetical protein AB1894_27640, partial [Chloroflexota bacterium]
MKADELIAELQAAQTPEDKAAILAEASFAGLPHEAATAARRCGFFPWFTRPMMAALLADTAEAEAEAAIQAIVSFPFTETIPSGYTYHQSTRQGLLKRYIQREPDEIAAAYTAVLPALLANWQEDESAVLALSGLVITGQVEEAIRRLDELLSRFISQRETRSILALLDALEQAQNLPFAPQIELDARQHFIWGWAAYIERDYETAIAHWQQAVALTPPGSPDLPMYLNNLGNGLSDRYARTGELAD